MNKLLSLLLFISSVASADLSNGTSYIFDSSGNALNSTSNALNAFLTNSSLPVTQSGTWNVNNISGTISLPTGASTASNQTTLGSQTTKINDGTNTMAVKAASTAAVATDPAAVVSISPNSEGQGTNTTSLPVVLSSNQTGINTFLDKSGTGNMTAACTTPTSCAAGTTVTAATNGSSTVNFTLTNTWVGTVVFEGLDGNSTWQSTIGTVPGNGSPTAASGTPINISIPSGGFSQVRARCTAFVSGTITANYNVGAGLSTLQVFNLTPSAFMATVIGSGTAGTPSTGVVSVQGVASGTPIVDNLSQIAGNAVNVGIGAAGTGTPRVSVSNDSLIKIWDGTNTAKVVAGSTQSALTDTAVVVTGRPDNVGTPTQTSVSCAGTSTTLLAASTATMFLSIRNPTTATQTVWINVAGSAAVAAAPSIDLSPGSEVDFFAEGASFLPTDQINCISGGTASTVTVVYK